jgi:hypothetical protein
MSAAAVIALISEIMANLPAIVSTGKQVIDLVNEGYSQLSAAVGDKEVTPEELKELIGKIVANSIAIQAIE